MIAVCRYAAGMVLLTIAALRADVEVTLLIAAAILVLPTPSEAVP